MRETYFADADVFNSSNDIVLKQIEVLRLFLLLHHYYINYLRSTYSIKVLYIL